MSIPETLFGKPVVEMKDAPEEIVAPNVIFGPWRLVRQQPDVEFEVEKQTSKTGEPTKIVITIKECEEQ